MDFSIITTVYRNTDQYRHFISTAAAQHTDKKFEIVVFVNEEPTELIRVVIPRAGERVTVESKPAGTGARVSRNLSYGIHMAALASKGSCLVFVFDPNVLLSFNILQEIDKLIRPGVIVTSAGNDTDVKISPLGTHASEYEAGDPDQMASVNERLLAEMGWPADPGRLELIPGKHRFPPPHLAHDEYLVAMARQDYFEAGGYPTVIDAAGAWHEEWVRRMCGLYRERRLEGCRIIHQYHRVWGNL